MRFFILFLTLFFIGCANKETKPLLAFEQNVSILPKSITLDEQEKIRFLEDFQTRYFAPWDKNTLKEDLHVTTWALRVFNKEKNYIGENLLPLSKKWFEDIEQFSNFKDFATVLQHAITINNINLRAHPTSKPLFKEFTYQSSSFPFDLLQSSFLQSMTPVLISHYSLDKSWTFVETSIASGWIKSSDLALVDEEKIKIIKNSKKIVITKENSPIFLTKGEKYKMSAKVGSIFPLKSEDENNFYILHVNEDGEFIEAFIKKEFATLFPLEFNDENIKNILNELLGENYGWGGLFENRDCSAFTRDFLATFGIFMPRNSASQKNEGVFVDISTISNKEKKEVIKQYATPYLSLIYLPGHIMLYTGEIDGEISVFHNIWGVRVKNDNKEDRLIIGKSIISDLDLGENVENIEKNSLLIDKIRGFNIMAAKQNEISTRLELAYPDTIESVSVKDNHIYFHDKTSMILDDGLDKNSTERLENADVEDMFFYKYEIGKPLSNPLFDAGRIRNNEFFKKLYGYSKENIEKNLVEVIWLPNKLNIKLLFNKNNGAALALQKVSDELDLLPDEYLEFLKNPAGTYNFRKIAKTKRLSMHSFGIAIDINVAKSHYWQWEKGEYKYKNLIPYEIVEIFEKHGFIWGGKWYSYDTMHFEYRPELMNSLHVKGK
ncbi:MAG: M15 family metallopeptidase [Campylobacteraceae bacterium]